MGRPDQLAKRILREETPVVTGRHVTFEVPPEVPVGALAPDGVVRVVLAPGLAALPSPWCRLRVEATLDVKMPGDHLDGAALARCELRRLARWTQRLEALRAAAVPRSDRPIAPEAADPRDYATWVVAPHVPRWLRRDAERGVLTLTEAGAGCWLVGPRDHDVLWLAANELPLRVELLPFLVARSGRAQAEFLDWAATVKGPKWTWDVVQELTMSAETADEYIYVPVDDEDQRRIKARYTRRLLEAYPEAANDIIERAREEGIEKGIESTLVHQFTRRLGRPLSDAECGTLAARLDTLGADRLGDVVLDLTSDALAAWLADADAS